VNLLKLFRLWTASTAIVLWSSVHAGLVPLEEWCVTTSAELQNALTVAATNNKVDVIKIETGTYDVPAGGFVFDASVAGGDHLGLTLSGGWINFFGNPCGQLGTENAFLTVLDGNETDRVLDITLNEGTSATIRLLTFLNGFADENGAGGGLWLRSAPGLSNYYGNIAIERNIFLDNEAFTASAARIHASAFGTDARIAFVNNVVVANHARSVSAVTLNVGNGNDGPTGSGVRVTNNTIISNTMDSDDTDSSAGLSASGTNRNMHIHNNNLWGNDTSDLRVHPGGNEGVFHLFNNNIGIRTGMTPTSQSNNISVEPEYEPCFLCFAWVPLASSPLVDGGVHPPTLVPFWYLTELDSNGSLRIHNGTVDIGAYESYERMFSDRFEAK